MKKMLLILSLCLCSFGDLIPNGFSNYLPIELPPVGAAIDSFPAFIVVDSTATSSDAFFTTADSSGADCVFAETDKTKLQAYRLYFSRGNKRGIWRVLIPTYPADGKIIRLYYGNPTHTEAARNTNVFRSKFKAVYGMQEAIDTIFDLTSNQNKGVPANTMLYRQAGRNTDYSIGSPIDYDNRRFVIADAASISALSPLTIRLTVKDKGSETAADILTKWSDVTNKEIYLSYYPGGGTPGMLDFNITDSTTGGLIGRRSAATSIADGNWHTLEAVWTGAANSSGLRLYLDNVRRDTSDNNDGSFTTIRNTTTNIELFDNSRLGNRGSIADISSVMIINDTLTTAEKNAMYNNELSLDEWYTIGAALSASSGRRGLLNRIIRRFGFGF